MVDRRFMGRIDARFAQGDAGRNPLDEPLGGGVSRVCVGGPAQCEAIPDQQIYDRAPPEDTVTQADAQHVQLSNRGLAVYEEFQNVVVLDNVHRLQTLDDAHTPEQVAYNDRCVTFCEILLRLRDMTLTHEDYF